MEQDVGLIGFGEAGSTFALAGDWAGHAHVHDIKTSSTAHRAAKLADYAAAEVAGCEDLAQLAERVDILLSLVTADQALQAAEAAAACLVPGTLFCDMNSVAPQTKQSAAKLIEVVGGQYVDVAVMAPVNPGRLNVPLLISGVHAEAAQSRLAALGFNNIQIVGTAIGRASSIKMIRSVMVKGMEALTAECVLAANEAGVLEDVLASLDASEKTNPWTVRADYNLDRMMIHGLRRAAEMEEVVKTLDGLGTGSAMTRGTVQRQREIGMLGQNVPAADLDGKLHQLNDGRAQAA